MSPSRHGPNAIRTKLLGLLFVFGIAAPESRAALVAEPPDTGGALVNPGMGWTLHYYSNIIANYGSRLEPADTLDDWPGLSTIYLRVPWSFLEPEEGQFNWSLFDTPAQRWIAKGKRIAIRVSCCESWLRHATPKWVHDAGAKGIDFEFGKGPKPGGPLWEPDYLDPVFLKKLESFLAAMARRYDCNPDVAFIDVGSFGMWGEGHTGFGSRLNDEQTLAVVKCHIDLHVRLFPRTLLCISDDVAGSSKPGAHLPATDYALSKGVTLRDDSILVQPPPKSWYHAELAGAFWPTLPVILEHEHYGPSKNKKAWDPELLVKSVEDYRASYMSIHWWPRELLAENKGAVARINRRIGYRIQLRKITLPSEIRLGEPFEIETSWANAGVAPCYGGGFLALTLKDDRGGIVSVNVDENFDVKNLNIGPPDSAPVATCRSSFVIARRFDDPTGKFVPNTQPGACDAFISVGRRDGTPTIALPHPGDDGQRRCKIGRVQLVP